MTIDGKAIAAEILARTKIRVQRLGRAPLVAVYSPLQTPATESYLKVKKRSAEAAGCRFEERPSPIAFQHEDIDAAIVQLPLPKQLYPDLRSQKFILDNIPLEKDADVLSHAAREKFSRGEESALLPPVVGAIAEIFKRYQIDPRGKQVVVIGKGFLVGEPAAIWLRLKLAAVSVVTDKINLERHLKDADIIISGAGAARIIRPEMLKQGVVLIDAGTSESGGEIVGDADPACAAKCSIFTPVPGGVGPIAVAKLFENAVLLAEQRS